MKVQVFESDNIYTLEKMVNDFILGRSPQEIVDIKYACHSEYLTEYEPAVGFYSAMIILVS